MHKSRVGASGFAENQQMEPLLYPPNQNVNVPDGYVSVRFTCSTSETTTSCCSSEETKYYHQHQIILPENTTVDQFLMIAARKVNSSEPFSGCRVRGIYKLRPNDPIGPTVKSYQYFESPVFSLDGSYVPAKQSCCLLV
ncbi:hypothetical protein M9Y10_039882 [Tritrichomonas musculus]|uniref:Uncharacterized protein n=1 Tax=Tritrichomonas musculus TaxID=1915356 RepID=A0ABR2GQN4_9EUKA